MTGGVAVVGSISADLTVFADPLPRPGETVIAEAFSMVLGGKGANQALAAVRAGARTFMVGAVGDDVFRELTLDTLTGEGIDTSSVQVVDGNTGIAHIRVDTATGQNDIAVVPNANHRLLPDAVEQSLRELAGEVSVVLIQLEIPLPVVSRVIENSSGGWDCNFRDSGGYFADKTITADGNFHQTSSYYGVHGGTLTANCTQNGVTRSDSYSNWP